MKLELTIVINTINHSEIGVMWTPTERYRGRGPLNIVVIFIRQECTIARTCEMQRLYSCWWWLVTSKKKTWHMNNWLVVYIPLWKIWKSVGVTISNIWKNKSPVPNHQTDTHDGFQNVLTECDRIPWWVCQKLEPVKKTPPSRTTSI